MPSGELVYTPLLPPVLRPTETTRRHLEADFERFATEPYPTDVAAYARESYAVDLSARLGPRQLPHPFGKASGQLSLNSRQVAADAAAGLAFVVLKTVIAERPDGDSRMAAWKIPASRMVCERIRSRRGEEGWTVTWIGRGWEDSLEAYGTFLGDALRIGLEHRMTVLPSVKLHLPADPQREPYDTQEDAHTLGVLREAWRGVLGEEPLLLEKDFSPTLAGSDRSREKESARRWIADMPRRIAACTPAGSVALGLKLMNALFEDDFQLEMLERATRAEPPVAFITAFNRLFDPVRTFEGVQGIAYGGFDLSDRNLAVLERWHRAPRADAPPISATGNIASGRLMAEYALRGATSGQCHTLFQLPRSELRSPLPRPRAALHELLFHPERGLIAALDHLRQAAGGTEIRFLDLPGLGRTLLNEREGRDGRVSSH